MSISLSSSFPVNFPGNFSRAVTPELDRRAHTERRVQMKPMPLPEPSWARHAVLAGCIGALLGSTAAFAVLYQQQIDPAVQSARSTPLETASPTDAVMAPLFDTAVFSSGAVTGVPSATASLTVNAQDDANRSSESYSEDAPDVPSATYHEPPKFPPASPAR